MDSSARNAFLTPSSDDLRSNTSGLYRRAQSATVGILSITIWISATVTTASAELWKCTPAVAGGTAYYTETPSFGDDVTCEEIRNLKYSKPGGGEPKQKKNKKEKDPLKKVKKKAQKPRNK